MPHEMLGYERDDVAGVLVSIQLLNKIQEKQQAEMNKPSTKSKQSGRRARMKNKQPGFVNNG